MDSLSAPVNRGRGDIAEFFVMRKYRGRGVGAQAATAFWRKAIRYPFQEHVRGTEIVQSFTAGL